MIARMLALFVVAGTAGSQQDPVPQKVATPEQQLQAKLAEPFLARADWTTDHGIARARAAAGGKLVFGYFTTAGY